MKQKKMLVLAALAVVICLMAGLWMATRPAAEAGGKDITVTIVHGDGSSKVFSCATQEDYLAPVLTQSGLVQGVDGPYGLEIHTVDGETADWNVDQSYWALYIGEDYATTGADGIVLTDGGAYSLVYTIG